MLDWVQIGGVAFIVGSMIAALAAVSDFEDKELAKYSFVWLIAISFLVSLVIW